MVKAATRSCEFRASPKLLTERHDLWKMLRSNQDWLVISVKVLFWQKQVPWPGWTPDLVEAPTGPYLTAIKPNLDAPGHVQSALWKLLGSVGRVGPGQGYSPSTPVPTSPHLQLIPQVNNCRWTFSETKLCVRTEVGYWGWIFAWLCQHRHCYPPLRFLTYFGSGALRSISLCT